MKKTVYSALVIAGISVVSSSFLLGMSEHARNIMEGLKLQGVEIKGVSKKPDTDTITYTAILGAEGDGGITCTKNVKTNTVNCSTFGRSDEGLSNFEKLSSEDAAAWIEIFDGWSLPPVR